MTPDEVRAKLKAEGYGFSRQQSSAGAASFWATDCSGKPVGRQGRWYQKRNVAAMMRDED
jgi:hypothetical protein